MAARAEARSGPAAGSASTRPRTTGFAAGMAENWGAASAISRIKDVLFLNRRHWSANFAGVTFSKPVVVVAACGALFLAAGGGWWIYQRSFVAWEAAKRQQDETAAAARAEPRVRQRVEIHPGPETPVVLARHATTAGNLAAVACSTCHTTRQPNLETRSGAALQEFHQGLTYRHGDLSCLSCHHAANYDTLRRADGTSAGVSADDSAVCAVPRHALSGLPPRLAWRHDGILGPHAGTARAQHLHRLPRPTRAALPAGDAGVCAARSRGAAAAGAGGARPPSRPSPHRFLTWPKHRPRPQPRSLPAREA
jgi:hypothetical protein